MKNIFSRFITTNPWLKLLSILMAIALWFFVASKGRSGIIMDVLIGFKNIPQELELVDATKTVSINIEGHERLIKNLREKEIGVVIDLRNARKGETHYSLSQDNVNLPRGLVVTKISPKTVRLMLEERLRKEVLVRPVIVGSPAEGLMLRKVEVTPEKVEIEGPASVITKIYAVKTEPVDITGITGEFQQNVGLNITKKNVRADVSEVKVNVYVGRAK